MHVPYLPLNRGKAVVSNATRWDTFGNLVAPEHTPRSEHEFKKRYKKSPSFLSLYMGVDASLMEGEHCHHILLDDWAKVRQGRGCRERWAVLKPVQLVLCGLACYPRMCGPSYAGVAWHEGPRGKRTPYSGH